MAVGSEGSSVGAEVVYCLRGGEGGEGEGEEWGGIGPIRFCPLRVNTWLCTS